MKWEDIKKNNPNAWSKLCSHRGWPIPEGISYYELSDIFEGKRLLYDFFDDNHIYIDISLEIQYTREIDEDDRNPHYVPEGFYYAINDDSYFLCGGGGQLFKTRKEAEEDSFTAAFELLEKKLSNETKV